MGSCSTLRLGWSRDLSALQDVRQRAAASAEAAASLNAQSGRGAEYSGYLGDAAAVDEAVTASVVVASAARVPKVQSWLAYLHEMSIAFSPDWHGFGKGSTAGVRHTVCTQ